MERQIILTADGSNSVAIPGMNVTYHSVHGAIQESLHVFIDAGLMYKLKKSQPGGLTILEMGFGTGLNALLTIDAMERNKTGGIHYTAVELYPLLTDEYRQLNYCSDPRYAALQPVFEELHACAWEEDIVIATSFTLLKTNQSLLQFQSGRRYDLVYFDAFAPAAQPELWTKELFESLFHTMHENGVLVTYCSKGDVRRNLLAAGFTVEKIPGPPGKREMLRAVKP